MILPINHRLLSLKKGFTLIELLVVISIIAILATLLMANLNSARSRARDVQRKSDLKNIGTALRLYFNDNGQYPTTNEFVWWGDPWTIGTTVYMTEVPQDPLPGESYFYERGSTSDTYTLTACLENSSDRQGKTSTSAYSCDSGMMFQVVQQ